MTSASQNSLLERAWAEREETIYPSLFGDLGPGIYPLDFELFRDVFGQSDVDPRWLHIGAFECPPNVNRNNWVYLSSGLSNAWEAEEPDANAWSGMGIEFLIQCNEQSKWALALARKFAAYQLLLGAGRYGKRGPIDLWDRMRIGTSIDGEDSDLQALLFAPSQHFRGDMRLLSGRFEFLQILGLTLAEHAYGQEHGFEMLHTKMQEANVIPVIDRRRRSII